MDRLSAATSASSRPGRPSRRLTAAWRATSPCLPDHPPLPHLTTPSLSAPRFPIGSPTLAPVPARESKETRKGSRPALSTSSSHPAVLAKSVEFKILGPRHRRRGTLGAPTGRLTAMRANVHVADPTATRSRALCKWRCPAFASSPSSRPAGRPLAVRTYVCPGTRGDPRPCPRAYLCGQPISCAPRRRPRRLDNSRDEVPDLNAVPPTARLLRPSRERMSAFTRNTTSCCRRRSSKRLDPFGQPSSSTAPTLRPRPASTPGRVGRSKTRAYSYITTPLPAR